MRIIAGEWRGRPLAAPEGADTRPTSDRAREGLFSMLASRIGTFDGLRVADLFAGTGALGLEALSRGGAHCTFVEKSPEALKALKANIARLGAVDRAEIVSNSIDHARLPSHPLDLVMMDPPYGKGLAERAFTRLAQPGWLAAGAWLSLEVSCEEIAIPPYLTLEAERRFGKAKILLLRG